MKTILFILIIFINIFANMAMRKNENGPSQRKDKRPLEIIDLSSGSDEEGYGNSGRMNSAALQPDAHKSFYKHQGGIKIGGEGGQANPSKKHKYTEPKIIYIEDDKPIVVDPENFKEFVQQKTGMNATINDNQQIVHHQNPLQIFKPQPQAQSTSMNHFYLQQLEQKLGLEEQISPRIGQGSSSSAFGVVGHQIHGQSRFAPGPGQNQQMSAANRPNDTENVNESRQQKFNNLIDKRREAKELKSVFENIIKKIGTLQNQGMEQNTQEIEMLRASKNEIGKLMDNLNVEITTLENELKRRN